MQAVLIKLVYSLKLPKSLNLLLSGKSYLNVTSVCVCVCACAVNHVQLFATLWTIAHQALLSMEFSRQEFLSGLSFPTPRDLPNRGIEPASLVFLALVDRCFYHWVLPKVYPDITSFTWITELPNDDMDVNFIVPYLCVCVSHSVVSDFLWPHGLLSGSPVHEILIVF